mmetsp:Transcript_67157/g.216652  ORF Transcript_67157/g.216652 Transcript_67157/m.216652 type:complete len:444 (+) Transcript_67157:109-1440(+)
MADTNLAAEMDTVGINGDTSFLMLCSALVFLMSLPGLALFYGGLVQSKNVLSIFMQCFGIVCVCGLLWAAIGYSLSFSGMEPYIGDLNFAFLEPMRTNRHAMKDHVPLVVFFLFQGTFAVITPALIIGSWAERAKFIPVLIFCALWEILVYCPVCHWIWGGGWLAQKGIRDFAGGLVVHATAGGAAIVAALMLPSRPGFPDKCAPPHNMPMVLTGASLLWVGWFGFNGGSALHGGTTAAMAAAVTAASAMVGTLVWLVIEGYRSKPTVEAAVTGMVAGLGSITPASGFVGMPGAIGIGLIAGTVCYGMTALIKERGLADDALDVFSVHGVGGLIGTVLTAFFSSSALGGSGYDEGVGMMQLLAVQCLGCLATLVWSVCISAALIKGLDLTIGFCHSRKEQEIGLDSVVHGGRAYDTQLAEEARKVQFSSDENESSTADDDSEA